ncbi:hypothetical protein ACSFA0_25105 [Variovorax sp. LT1P1]|uniref:hypothetical protein n=1 Tax=Variovorax sp. LT1P1 TaxID=3443730 RepID=UPI003F47A629
MSRPTLSLSSFVRSRLPPALLPAIRRHSDFFPPGRTVIIHAGGHANPAFLFPSHTRWHDFPVVLDARMRVPEPTEAADHDNFYRGLLVLDDTAHRPIGDEALRLLCQDPGQVRLVCACDVDASGAWMFAQACSVVLGTSGFPRAFDIRLVSLAPEHAGLALNAAVDGLTTDARETGFRAKELQRRFEYNWWVNAHALLRPVMARVGLDSDRALSKFELQLAYFVLDRGPLPFIALMREMNRWTGTGKYAPGTLGTTSSRGQMITNLRNRGVFGPEHGSSDGSPSSDQVHLTAEGHALLGALPKDSRDLDLPQRLAGWAADPVASRHKADSYIRHWFGKVKRVSPPSGRKT